jgi:hypothetical protein
MSEHSLPPDPSSWPRDPFRLLGVEPGVSARDLRKAYLRLIRSYKPEHSPEEFKRIREAYESALPWTRTLEGRQGDSEAEAEPEPSNHFPPGQAPQSAWTPRPDDIAAAPDPWDLACRGEPEAAYRALLERQREGRAAEDDYLQLYWLLTLIPALEPTRVPVDWLGQGLGAVGPDSPRMRELLRRELAADPTLALGDRLKGFFRRRTSPALAVDFAEARWRAARDAGRWGVILADLHSLRTWMPDVNEDAWAQLLVAAAMNLAWADGRDADQVKALARELEDLGSRRNDHSDDLYQLEYVQMVKIGLDRLGGRNGPYSGIYRLLAISWDEQAPEFRARLRAYVDQLAQGPSVALQCLDEVQATAPAVLGRLSTLLGGFEFEAFYFLGPDRLDEIAPAIGRFLDSHIWTEYPSLRPSLLKFCLGEAVAPGLVARTLSERAEFILTGKNPLAQHINDDWPLRHVYRAAEMARATPDER